MMGKVVIMSRSSTCALVANIQVNMLYIVLW